MMREKIARAIAARFVQDKQPHMAECDIFTRMTKDRAQACWDPADAVLDALMEPSEAMLAAMGEPEYDADEAEDFEEMGRREWAYRIAIYQAAIRAAKEG